MRPLKSSEHIHKKEGGSYYAVSANKPTWSSRAYMTILTNFQRKIAEPNILYGREL